MLKLTSCTTKRLRKRSVMRVQKRGENATGYRLSRSRKLPSAKQRKNVKGWLATINKLFKGRLQAVAGLYTKQH